MDGPTPWHVRLRARLKKFWHSPNPRVQMVRDFAVAGGFVLLLLGAVWIYTGQPLNQAPLVVVESGSMMHGQCLSGEPDRCGGKGADDDPGFGRVGTIDPGDLVLVQDVDSFDDVETAFGSGRRSGYGGHGDVLVYRPRPGQGLEPAGTPIIHRAMLLVKVKEEGCRPNAPENPCTFIIPETCNEGFGQFVQGGVLDEWRNYCTGSQKPVSMDLRRDSLFLTLLDYPCPPSMGQNCQPFYSGFLTKGDNNEPMDQPTGSSTQGPITCCPVTMDQIVGRARGEIPWFGLIKLALAGNPKYKCDKNQPCSDPTLKPQTRVFNAVAPRDLWFSLVLSAGFLLVLPVAIDRVTHWVRRRREKAKQEEKPPPSK